MGGAEAIHADAGLYFAEQLHRHQYWQHSVSGLVPSALLAWVFFQESTSEGVGSIVNNAQLIRKIYFPREVFPITGVITKLIEFVINSFVLACMMLYFGVAPASTIARVPVILLYLILASLTVEFIGAALNVFDRDIDTMFRFCSS